MTLARVRVGRLVRCIGTLAVLGLVTGCQAAVPSPTPPRPTPAPSTDPTVWTRVDPNAIEQPQGFMTVHQDANGQLHTTCAPCHPAVDTTMTGVAAGRAGLVAVGWIFQGFHGITWHSADGSRWTQGPTLPENTELSAVAASSNVYVAVGLDGSGATAWTSTDGLAWSQTQTPDAFAAKPLRLTAVTAWGHGFVAVGYEGYEFGSATAAFWVSPDGVAWQRAPDAPAFADARAWSVTQGGPGLVAVGTSGPSDRPGPAIVWTSRDGLHWTAAPASPSFADGRMRTVTTVPGIGVVAAGEDLRGDTGVVWTSPNGLDWTRVPSTPDLGNPGIQVRMYAAIGGGPGVVIVGTATEGTQYGEAVLWTSPDGLRWRRWPRTVDFADGELTAVAHWRTGIVGVGDRGAPDTYIATVWRSPAGWADQLP